MKTTCNIIVYIPTLSVFETTQDDNNNNLKLLFSWFHHKLHFHLLAIFSRKDKCKAKAIPVTDREGPQGSETSRLPYFL
jgi:hypothetical protein